MTHHNKKILIYGAYGYTGRLILQEALRQGLQPMVSGRNVDQVEQLAAQYQLTARPFRLASVDTVAKNLHDIDLVINCAGPFSHTAEMMMRGCLLAQADYIDITGEWPVFELAHSFATSAKSAGVILCPGAGFDVIPTDCLAAQLQQKLPTANHLKLAFAASGGVSRGTALTSIEGLTLGGRVRRDGQLIKVPLAYQTQLIPFADKKRQAVTIPWGDLVTAYYSTGINNIEVYLAMPAAQIRRLRWLRWLRPLLALPPVQSRLKARVRKQVTGPSAQTLQQGVTQLWGEVSDGKRRVSATLQTANGYQLTALGSIEIAKFILDYEGAGGYYTPSQLCGNDLVNRLPGSSKTEFSGDL